MRTGDMPRRPVLKSYLRQIPEDDGVTFRGGAATVTLRGRSVHELLPDLLPRLDGTRTLAELGTDLPHVSEEVLLGALQVLQAQNLLADADADADAADGRASRAGAGYGQDSFWESVAGGAPVRLDGAAALVGGQGQLAAETAEVLERSGVSARRADSLVGLPTAGLPAGGTDVSLVVWCSDSPEAADLAAVNTSAVRAGVPWLAATLGANHATVGPLVLPGQSACHECFRLRLRGNRSMLDDALGTPVATAVPRREPALPAYFVTLVAATAAAEAVRRLSGLARPATVGAFLSLTPAEAVASRHEVLKLPRCPVCGPVRYRPQMKIWDLTRDEDAAREARP